MKKNIIGYISLFLTGFLVIAAPSIIISQIFSEENKKIQKIQIYH